MYDRHITYNLDTFYCCGCEESDPNFWQVKERELLMLNFKLMDHLLSVRLNF